MGECKPLLAGALTQDIFHLGHEPGWFFDKWYATGSTDGRVVHGISAATCYSQRYVVPYVEDLLPTLYP